jgi:hypothetical protein
MNKKSNIGKQLNQSFEKDRKKGRRIGNNQ